MKHLIRWYSRASTADSCLQSPLLPAIRLDWGWQFAPTGCGKMHNMAKIVDFLASLNIHFPSASAILWLGLSFLEEYC